MYGSGGSRMNPAIHSTPLRRHMPEIIVAIGLAVAPFILPHIGISEDLMTRILIWGLFGLGFDLLFGYTGLLSFGQAAFRSEEHTSELQSLMRISYAVFCLK